MVIIRYTSMNSTRNINITKFKFEILTHDSDEDAHCSKLGRLSGNSIIWQGRSGSIVPRTSTAEEQSLDVILTSDILFWIETPSGVDARNVSGLVGGAEQAP